MAVGRRRAAVSVVSSRAVAVERRRAAASEGGQRGLVWHVGRQDSAGGRGGVAVATTDLV
jgi:hypothetical protein